MEYLKSIISKTIRFSKRTKPNENIPPDCIIKTKRIQSFNQNTSQFEWDGSVCK